MRLVRSNQSSVLGPLTLAMAVAILSACEPRLQAGGGVVDGGDTSATLAPEPWSATEAPDEVTVDRETAVPLELETVDTPTPSRHPGVASWAVLRSPADYERWFGAPAPASLKLGDAALIVYDAPGIAGTNARASVLEAFVVGSALHVVTSTVAVASGCSDSLYRERARHAARVELSNLPELTEVHFAQRRVELSCAEAQRDVRWLREANAFFDQMEGEYALIDAHPVDRQAWAARSLETMLATPRSTWGFYAVARDTLLQFPMGHAYMFDDTFALPYAGYSSTGACGRPSGDSVVVTQAVTGNPLGLRVGDEVVGLNNLRGAALEAAAFRRPQGGASSAAADNRRYQAAVALLGLVKQGDVLWVRRGGRGDVERVNVTGAAVSVPVDCTDPHGEDRAVAAASTVRPDGVAVIRLPTFYPQDLPANPTQQQLDDSLARLRAAILAELHKVRSAPFLVWDIRGNGGGSAQLALDIVAGMPTARTTRIARCKFRDTAAKPGHFVDNPYIDYRVTAGGDFAYAGKVAVVADGLSISAADYFLYGVETATDVPIFGSSGASAYGASNQAFEVSRAPSLIAASDSNLCLGTSDEILEGHQVEPHQRVDLLPADLSAGLDTQLEAAARWLKAQ